MEQRAKLEDADYFELLAKLRHVELLRAEQKSLHLAAELVGKDLAAMQQEYRALFHRIAEKHGLPTDGGHRLEDETREVVTQGGS